jgi:glycosyltransferase involved in cell wall biosynthesis
VRILAVSNYYPEHVGGIESLAATLVAGFRRNGHQVRWMAGDLSDRPHHGDPDDVPVRVWNAVERLGFPYPVQGPASMSLINKQVAWSEVVHLHDCLYAVNVASFLAARRQHRPVLLTQHIAKVPYTNPLIRGLQSLAYASLGRAVLSNADQVAFETEEVHRWFEPRVHFQKPPVVIESGVDTELFRPASEAERLAYRERLGVSAEQPLLLFVGRFVEKKGIKLIRPVIEAHPDWSWLFIGRAGDVDPQSWHLPNLRVIDPLAHAELRNHYVAADLLVLPSLGEGFPVVAQEAMSCGLPTLLSAQTARGLPAVRDVVFTMSTETDDLNDAVQKAVAAVFPDDTLRGRVAELARERWTAEAFVARYEEQLEGLLH